MWGCRAHSAGMWGCRAHSVVTGVVYCMYCFDMTPLPLPPSPSLYSCGCLAMSWQTRSVCFVLMTSTSSAARRRLSSSGPWKRHSPANPSSPNSSYTSEIRSATLCTTVHYTCTCTCAVLLCLVCLFAFACFFLSSFSHLSLKHVYMYMYMYVLCCFALFVCLTLLASFFLPSHLSFKNMYTWWCIAFSSNICV